MIDTQQQNISDPPLGRSPPKTSTLKGWAFTPPFAADSLSGKSPLLSHQTAGVRSPPPVITATFFMPPWMIMIGANSPNPAYFAHLQNQGRCPQFRHRQVGQPLLPLLRVAQSGICQGQRRQHATAERCCALPQKVNCVSTLDGKYPPVALCGGGSLQQEKSLPYSRLSSQKKSFMMREMRTS